MAGKNLNVAKLCESVGFRKQLERLWCEYLRASKGKQLAPVLTLALPDAASQIDLSEFLDRRLSICESVELAQPET